MPPWDHLKPHPQGKKGWLSSLPTCSTLCGSSHCTMENTCVYDLAHPQMGYEKWFGEGGLCAITLVKWQKPNMSHPKVLAYLIRLKDNDITTCYVHN